MKRDRAKELAPVIQAYGNGVMVQLRRVGAKWSNIWEDLGSTANFEDESVEWRIKPEPRKFVLYANGTWVELKEDSWVKTTDIHATEVLNE